MQHVVSIFKNLQNRAPISTLSSISFFSYPLPSHLSSLKPHLCPRHLHCSSSRWFPAMFFTFAWSVLCCSILVDHSGCYRSLSEAFPGFLCEESALLWTPHYFVLTFLMSKFSTSFIVLYSSILLDFVFLVYYGCSKKIFLLKVKSLLEVQTKSKNNINNKFFVAYNPIILR